MHTYWVLVPGSVLNALDILPYLILTTTLWGRYLNNLLPIADRSLSHNYHLTPPPVGLVQERKGSVKKTWLDLNRLYFTLNHMKFTFESKCSKVFFMFGFTEFKQWWIPLYRRAFGKPSDLFLPPLLQFFLFTESWNQGWQGPGFFLV